MGLRVSFSVVDDLGFPESRMRGTTLEKIDYSEGCETFVSTFLEVALAEVPVRTGYLKSTIEGSSTDDSCTCETDCDYAQYVEFGTERMAAQPYFQPALEAALEAAIPIWWNTQIEAWHGTAAAVSPGMPSIED